MVIFHSFLYVYQRVAQRGPQLNFEKTMMAQDTQQKLKTKKHVMLFKTNLAKSLGQRPTKWWSWPQSTASKRCLRCVFMSFKLYSMADTRDLNPSNWVKMYYSVPTHYYGVRHSFLRVKYGSGIWNMRKFSWFPYQTSNPGVNPLWRQTHIHSVFMDEILLWQFKNEHFGSLNLLRYAKLLN